MLERLWEIDTNSFWSSATPSKKQPGKWAAQVQMGTAATICGTELEALEVAQAALVQMYRQFLDSFARFAENPGAGYELLVDGAASARTYSLPELARAAAGLELEWVSGHGARGKYWSSGKYLVMSAQKYRAPARVTRADRVAEATAWHLHRLDQQ